MTRHRVFDLVDPPLGQADVVVDAIDRIAFPWARLIPTVRGDRDRAVVVRWGPLRQGESGRYTHAGVTVDLESTTGRDTGDVAFVFAHEVGHLVDNATLTRDDRAELTLLVHPGLPLGHLDHGHPDADHEEQWRDDTNPYVTRLSEAYADLFVAAFAPSLWEGRHRRFLHWTDDVDAITDITLRRAIVPFPDIAPDRWSAASIEKAAAAGILTGRADGRFDPDAPVDREELAVVLDRLGVLDRPV